MSFRLRVDPVACDAFGYCAELLPEMVWLDEWGYPVVDPSPVPPGLLSTARQAVRTCPRKAFILSALPREGSVGTTRTDPSTHPGVSPLSPPSGKPGRRRPKSGSGP